MALTKRQLHLLGVIGESRSPQDELQDRLNLELQQGHSALDIPVTDRNRAYWRTVWEAQHQDPVYS